MIAQQCDFPLELIIGEDLSTDGTKAIAEKMLNKYRDTIRIVVANRNVGITANFLRLVARARGRYIALLEGDDYWTDPQKTKKQVELMELHHEYAWCAAKTENRAEWLPVKEKYTLEDVLRRYFVHTSTVIFRREILDKYPKFPDTVCWESMLLAYLTEQGDCGFVDDTVSYYRRHEGGLWNNADRMERIFMSRTCIDAMDVYFDGKYREQLADRELWLYEMDIAQQPVKGFWRYWRNSMRILLCAARRVGKEQKKRYLLLWIRFLGQPLVVRLAATRAKLAVGTRLSRLVEKT